MKQIILIGDSLTQRGYECDGGKIGWVSRLANDYIRRADIVNRGFSGYNTEWCKSILETVLSLSHVSPIAAVLYVVFLGANDAVLAGEKQHVPIDQYAQNLHEIVAQIRRFQAGADILLVSPPPIHEEMWRAHRLSQGRQNSDRTFEHSWQYSERCVQVGKNLGIPVLPLHQVFLNDSAPGNIDGIYNLSKGHPVDKMESLKTFLTDGVHLSFLGNQIVHRALVSLIETHFPHLKPSSLKSFYPYYEYVDISNLRRSLVPY